MRSIDLEKDGKNSVGASSKSLARIVTVTEIWFYLSSTWSLLSGAQSQSQEFFYPFMFELYFIEWFLT